MSLKKKKSKTTSKIASLNTWLNKHSSEITKGVIVTVIGAIILGIGSWVWHWRESKSEMTQKDQTAEFEFFKGENSLLEELSFKLCRSIADGNLCPLNLSLDEPEELDNLVSNQKKFWIKLLFRKLRDYEANCSRMNEIQQKEYISHFFLSVSIKRSWLNLITMAKMSGPETYDPTKPFRELSKRCEDILRTPKMNESQPSISP